MLSQEIKNHVASFTDIAGIHGNLSEEILHVGHNHRQRTQVVPQIIQCEQTFAVATGRLVFERHE